MTTTMKKTLHHPNAAKLVLTGVTARLEDWIEPVPSKSLKSITKGVGHSQEFVLILVFRLFVQRYKVDWKLKPLEANTESRN